MINKSNYTVCNARNDKARQYHRLYLSCFSIFLVITVLGRLLPQQWRFQSGDLANRQSIIEEAKERTGTFVPYLFMNY